MKYLLFILFLFSGACYYANPDTCALPWPEGVVRYTFWQVSQEDQNATKKIFDDITKDTEGLIKFEETQEFGDGILHIGTVDSSQFQGLSTVEGYRKHKFMGMILANFNKRTVTHELGHSLGLMHEHQRKDRDLYISINWSECDSLGMAQQFLYRKSKFYNYKDFAYDYKSVMHYTEEEAYIIDSRGHELGGETFSVIDKQKLRSIYADEAKKQISLFNSERA